jgi:hypothetical protein
LLKEGRARPINDLPAFRIILGRWRCYFFLNLGIHFALSLLHSHRILKSDQSFVHLDQLF